MEAKDFMDSLRQGAMNIETSERLATMAVYLAELAKRVEEMAECMKTQQDQIKQLQEEIALIKCEKNGQRFINGAVIEQVNKLRRRVKDLETEPPDYESHQYSGQEYGEEPYLKLSDDKMTLEEGGPLQDE